MTIFFYISFAEVANFLVIFVREPRCTYDRTISSGACIFNERWAVETIGTYYWLVHAKFTHFFHNQCTFLVQRSNDDNIRFCLLDFSQLCREICIFISKCFCRYNLNPFRFQSFFRCIVYRNHLVIVVGIHNRCCFET